MTITEIVTISIAGLNILLTAGGLIVGATRGMHAIKDYALQEAEVVQENTLEAVRNLREEFQDSQQTQDHTFGEGLHSLRRALEDVGRKISEVELWGRDHYVQKEDFQRAVDGLSANVKEGFALLRTEFSSLRSEIREDMKKKEL